MTLQKAWIIIYSNNRGLYFLSTRCSKSQTSFDQGKIEDLFSQLFIAAAASAIICALISKTETIRSSECATLRCILSGLTSGQWGSNSEGHFLLDSMWYFSNSNNLPQTASSQGVVCIQKQIAPSTRPEVGRGSHQYLFLSMNSLPEHFAHT